MTEIIVIRHGQANSTAKTEEDYDRLCPQGHQQAQWLGETLRAQGYAPDRVIAGTLRRHRETAEGMGYADPLVLDDRLNEMRYFDLGDGLLAIKGVPLPTSEKEFAQHFPQVLRAWKAGVLDHLHKPYAAFQGDAVSSLLDHGAQVDRLLVISSGGIIDALVCDALGLDMQDMVGLLPHVLNTSLHRFVIKDGALRLKTYNATPHLDHADRLHAKTEV